MVRPSSLSSLHRYRHQHGSWAVSYCSQPAQICRSAPFLLYATDPAKDDDNANDSSSASDKDETVSPSSSADSDASSSADAAAVEEEEAAPARPIDDRLQQMAQSDEPDPQEQPRRLDPLVRSLTRMDEQTASAPVMKIPIWGELILDKSLFVLLPVVAFAVIGFATSIYILINSGDSLVDALTEAGGANTVSTPTPPPAIPAPAGGIVDPNAGCRGICSSQQDDYESLKVFMNSLAGK